MNLRLKPIYRNLTVLLGVIILSCFFLGKYERGVSPHDSVVFFYPSWPCGECPPFLVLTADDVRNAQFVGEDSRVFVNGEDLWGKANNYDFFLCKGQYKQSVRMFLWECFVADSESECSKPFFDADECELIAPGKELLHRKDKLMERLE